MRARRIENLEALQLKASEIAQITVKELEARHYLVWWLSSYDRNMKRGYNNETICLSTYQVNEFCFSYAITSEVEKFYLLIQPENWFLNDLAFESASIDDKGLVLNLAEVNDQLFKLYISRMQIRFNLDEIHAERLTHAKKYAKELFGLLKDCSFIDGDERRVQIPSLVHFKKNKTVKDLSATIEDIFEVVTE